MDDLLSAIRAVLAPQADDAPAWIAAGFDDPEEIAEWCAARCFTAAAAARLEEIGCTPAQAAKRINANGYEDTIGYHSARGDLSLAEARRIITNAFWHG